MKEVVFHTMESTTNYKFKHLESTTGILMYDERLNVYWFNNFHTSNVKAVDENLEDKTITITTLNSVYKFKEN